MGCKIGTLAKSELIRQICTEKHFALLVIKNVRAALSQMTLSNLHKNVQFSWCSLKSDYNLQKDIAL